MKYFVQGQISDAAGKITTPWSDVCGPDGFETPDAATKHMNLLNKVNGAPSPSAATRVLEDTYGSKALAHPGMLITILSGWVITQAYKAKGAMIEYRLVGRGPGTLEVIGP